MPVLEARTEVYRSAEAVFDALLDLRRYEAYSDHLAAVERVGDGGVGTEYTLRFEWWLVSYTVRSEVTAVERPDRLDFAVTKGIQATGSWFVEPVSTGEDPVTEVRFVVEYDPDTVAGAALSLPALTSMSWVIERVAPLVEQEAAGVVRRVVNDLEGSDRAVDLNVEVR